eukprot:10617113-Prorocentrum_lima.AAC.1
MPGMRAIDDSFRKQPWWVVTTLEGLADKLDKEVLQHALAWTARSSFYTQVTAKCVCQMVVDS